MGSPVVICALGGSGTRVVARIVSKAGCYMGSNRNRAEDAVEFVEFYDRWINRYLLREVAPLCREEDDLMSADFHASVARHLAEIPGSTVPWGWKEPRSHFLLPFLHAKYPELKLIHVIRDGRDMAFSQNRNQLRKHGPAILAASLLDAPPPVQMAALWSRVNLTLGAYAEAHLRGQYLLVQLERLCADSDCVARQIVSFLGLRDVDLDFLSSEIVTPASIGRWRKQNDIGLIGEVEAEARSALVRFGYCS